MLNIADSEVIQKGGSESVLNSLRLGAGANAVVVRLTGGIVMENNTFYYVHALDDQAI